MTITNDIRYIGVNDHAVDLFEGQYLVPRGIAYNSYVILDEKIAVMDTVDGNFTRQWLDNLAAVLEGRTPDYLIVHHMEPDHAANVDTFLQLYPNATVVASGKAFAMMKGFFGTDYAERRLVVGEGDTLCLGKHTLAFVTAPMVHWPEVIVSYDLCDKVLFSADGFGKFGALDMEEPWEDEARRYYIGIVGKYGAQVQALLKKAAALDIAIICPTHGPVLTENLGHYLNLYDIWSAYRVESEGIVIAYTSIYGNTKAAVELLAQRLRDKGAPKVVVHDLARCDMAQAVSDAFRFGKLVLATTTYNADIFPRMKTFLHALTERSFQNRTVGLIENGSWAPMAAKIMKNILSGSKDLRFTDAAVRIRSALNDESRLQLEALADELTMEYQARLEEGSRQDPDALNSIGYGLYVVTSRDEGRDNGLIVNTVTQVTNTPNRVAVTINKDNYSHDVIRKTGLMNVCCLDVTAPFSLFERFGFHSGRNVDKFDGIQELRSANGLRFLPGHINSFLSLQVEQYVDLGTHGMFICSVTEARVCGSRGTMTYSFYLDHVKPKPATEGKTGYVCKVCGWVYEGQELPADIVCPLCKHGAADFEPIQ